MYKFTEINGKTNSEHSLKSKVVVMHNLRQREKCVRESFPGDKIWFWGERSQKFQMLPKNCLLVKIRSHIGCICLIFLYWCANMRVWERTFPGDKKWLWGGEARVRGKFMRDQSQRQNYERPHSQRRSICILHCKESKAVRNVKFVINTTWIVAVFSIHCAVWLRGQSSVKTH